jgi:hypothetical protein
MKHFLNRKQLIIVGIMLLLALLGGIAYYSCVITEEEITPVFSGVSEIICSVSDGQSHTQTFIAPENNMLKTTVRLAYENGKPESGELVFTLKDQSGAMAGEIVIDTAGTRNNSPVAIAFDMQKDSKGKEYTLILATRGIAEATPVSLRGETTDGVANAFLSTTNEKYRYPASFLIIMLVAAVGLLPALAVGKNKKEAKACE